ncbi:MAG TPA: hypothetical protein VJ499_16570 [Flavisolibacter sp.]|nr:hypothetical protein [Flavisolibacter sp.]
MDTHSHKAQPAGNGETWPGELDALRADPLHHQLLFENELVRVLDTLIQPGDITELHTHCFAAALYVISWSDFIRYDAQGNVILDSRSLPTTPAPNTALWTSALGPHRLRIVGTAPLHIISTELKS